MRIDGCKIPTCNSARTLLKPCFKVHALRISIECRRMNPKELGWEVDKLDKCQQCVM